MSPIVRGVVGWLLEQDGARRGRDPRRVHLMGEGAGHSFLGVAGDGAQGTGSCRGLGGR